MTTRALIGYARVSTSQQGRSGLGIEAQREALARFAASEGFELVRVFVEVETGKGSDALERRPQLLLKAVRRSYGLSMGAALHRATLRPGFGISNPARHLMRDDNRRTIRSNWPSVSQISRPITARAVQWQRRSRG